MSDKAVFRRLISCGAYRLLQEMSGKSGHSLFQQLEVLIEDASLTRCDDEWKMLRISRESYDGLCFLSAMNNESCNSLDQVVEYFARLMSSLTDFFNTKELPEAIDWRDIEAQIDDKTLHLRAEYLRQLDRYVPDWLERLEAKKEQWLCDMREKRKGEQLDSDFPIAEHEAALVVFSSRAARKAENKASFEGTKDKRRSVKIKAVDEALLQRMATYRRQSVSGLLAFCIKKEWDGCKRWVMRSETGSSEGQRDGPEDVE